MDFPKKKIILIVAIILIIIAVLASGIFFALHFLNNKKVGGLVSKNNVLAVAVARKPPETIKAVYVTGYSAGTKSYVGYLSNFLDNTEINAVVIDLKGSDGVITYPKRISDIDTLVRFLHGKNIYVIGRIAVFEDPVYAKARPELAVYNKNGGLWQDRNGLLWLDPASKDVWDYNIFLAKDALANHGFDEINFDYVRFPTDGKTGEAGFPVYDGKVAKAEIIKEFFEYTRQQLLNEKISIDLFGLTTVNKDDMGIGQIIEDAFYNFDYVCPMVYPSHFADGFIGFANPADHPYEVIKYSMDSALARKNIIFLTKLRPWLQDFNLGAYYTADMVKQEIKAVQDSLASEYNGFMLWNPRNIYTQDAILKITNPN
ncbi:MAG: GTP-binding protein [Candidatus Staskawiczbacteria bacterium]|nr:GTP-binding protein [Candidatus Staskawiczbacteria bacterium]